MNDIQRHAAMGKLAEFTGYLFDNDADPMEVIGLLEVGKQVVYNAWQADAQEKAANGEKNHGIKIRKSTT